MASKPKQICKYGANCYRKNRAHLESYEHTTRREEDDDPMKKKDDSSQEEDEEAYDYGQKSSNSENKENKVDLSKTIDMRDDDNEGLFDNIEKIDLNSVHDIKALVQEYCQMNMPDDFYEFFEFSKSVNPKDPKNALNDVGLELSGIYDLICLGLKVDYRLHSRYFYDVPEFQTILNVKNSPNMTHFGYFRDDPNEMPNFVGFNEAKLDCKIHCKGDNIFSAVNWYLEELINGRSYKSSSSVVDGAKKLKENLHKWCDEHHKGEKTFSLQLKTPKIKSREKKINCKTFHGAGICVPVDSKGFGYREVPENDEKLKKIFENFCSENESDKTKREKALEKIQEIITLIQFANDESDYGMGVEFGVNMFCFGDLKLHKFMKSTIIVSYKLLGRDLYADILIEHLKNRKLKL